MDFKKEYLQAIEGHKYDELINILIKNLIENFDYKAISDLGSYLCDIDSPGLQMTLNEDECIKLGKILVRQSYYSHPDVSNAFAFQVACLERGNDYQEVINMLDTASKLNNALVINNIAYAQYKSGLLYDALELQKSIAEKDKNNIILKYNFMLYELFSGADVRQKYNAKEFLDLLISDDIFDYESAILLAVYFDNFDFVKSNIDYLRKTFECNKSADNIIDDYINNRKIPQAKEIEELLMPKTCYENGFYLTE